MTSQYPQYPLVQKAIDEQAALFNFLGGAAPPDLLALQNRVLDLADRYIDRPDHEKEAMMASLVLFLSPPFIFDEPGRFAADYSPAVQAIVDMQETLVPGGPIPPVMAQIQALLALGAIKQMTQDIANGNLPPGATDAVLAETLQAAQSPGAAAEEAVFFSHLQSPALQELFMQSKAEMLDALRQHLSGTPPAPKDPQKPAAPKPPRGPGSHDL